MTAQTGRLEHLVDLAGEQSSERRRELLRDITDVFLEKPETHSQQATQYFSEIMGKVAFDLEQQVRAELAEKLAEETSAPQDLIRRLANDTIDVAQPILEQSPVLTQADLIGIAEQGGQDHLIAITGRKDIGPDLSCSLVERGDDRVVEGLVRNKTAEISRDTMERIVTRAETNERLHDPVVDRPDLPPDLMQEMFWCVSKQLREKILKQTSMIDGEKLDQMLEEVESKHKDKQNDDVRQLSKPEAFVKRLVDQDELNEYALVTMAKARQVPELICGLAELTDIDLVTAKRVLFDRTGEGLAIACRAHGFDRTTFSTFILTVDPANPRSIEETYRLLNIYDKLEPATAQRIMRFWKVRKGVARA